MPHIGIGLTVDGRGTAWKSPNCNLAFEGHSFIASPLNFTTTHITADVTILGSTFINAVNGSTMNECSLRSYTLDDKVIAETSVNKNILVLWIGINDLSDSLGNGTTLYNLLKTYVQDRVNVGWKVFVYTMTPCNVDSGGGVRGAAFEAKRNTFNGLMRSDLSSLSNVYILDTDTKSALTDCTNLTYFSDGLHPTDAGGVIAASLFHDKIRSVSKTFVTPTLLSKLIGYWKLNEVAGNALDSLGVLNATPSGVTQQGTYYEFVKASNSRVNFGAIAGHTTYSVSMWCKLTNTALAQIFGTGGVLGGLMSAGGDVYYNNDAGTGNVLATAAWNDTTNYHHIVLIVSVIGLDTIGRSQLFFDGVAKGTKHFVTSGLSAFNLGAEYNNGAFPATYHASCRIKEVGLFNILTSTDIVNLYNAGAGKTYPF